MSLQQVLPWVVSSCLFPFKGVSPGGGGGSYIGLKTGTDFAHFGLESGMVFDGTSGVYERIYRFNSKCERKTEKYANSKLIWRIFLFAL